MLGSSLRIYVATVLAFLVIRLDVFLVNGYLGNEQAGIYSVVANFAEMIYLLPTVVGLNLFPRVARGASFEYTASVFRIMAVLYGGLCLVSIPLIAPTISILFGPQFADAVSLYYWIVPGVFCLGMLHHPLESLRGPGVSTQGRPDLGRWPGAQYRDQRRLP